MILISLAVACLIIQGVTEIHAYTDCEIQRQGPSPEWAKPKCNPDGSYKIYQCDPYTRTVCWCVYSNGQMVPGTTRKVHDPEQEKRDLADCAKAIKSAPNAPPPAPAPSAVLDPRLGYNLGTEKIPESSLAYSAPSQPCPADCPAPCPLNCIPTQTSMVNIDLPPVQIQLPPAPAPAPAFQLPMPAPQPMPCPQPCQGIYCPPGCPQTYTAPVQQIPQFQQQRQCPQFCSVNCPPGCPTTPQSQPQFQMPQPQYQMPQPQYQMAQPQYQMSQPQFQMPQPQYQMPQPQYQMPQPQFQMAQPQYQMPQTQQQQQQCPFPCTSSCPPGCSLQFMDPATGSIQLPQQLNSMQPQQRKYALQNQHANRQGFYNSRKHKLRKPAVKSNRYTFRNPLKNYMKKIQKKPAGFYRKGTTGRIKNSLVRRMQNHFRTGQHNLENFWQPW